MGKDGVNIQPGVNPARFLRQCGKQFLLWDAGEAGGVGTTAPFTNGPIRPRPRSLPDLHRTMSWRRETRPSNIFPASSSHLKPPNSPTGTIRGIIRPHPVHQNRSQPIIHYGTPYSYATGPPLKDRAAPMKPRSLAPAGTNRAAAVSLEWASLIVSAIVVSYPGWQFGGPGFTLTTSTLHA
jgi:hypothetical protein